MGIILCSGRGGAGRLPVLCDEGARDPRVLVGRVIQRAGI